MDLRSLFPSWRHGLGLLVAALGGALFFYHLNGGQRAWSIVGAVLAVVGGLLWVGVPSRRR